MDGHIIVICDFVVPGGLKSLGSLKKVNVMPQVVITFISSKYYIMYLFLRRFVRFRFWPGALLISHTFTYKGGKYIQHVNFKITY